MRALKSNISPDATLALPDHMQACHRQTPRGPLLAVSAGTLRILACLGCLGFWVMVVSYALT